MLTLLLNAIASFCIGFLLGYLVGHFMTRIEMGQRIRSLQHLTNTLIEGRIQKHEHDQ